MFDTVEGHAEALRLGSCCSWYSLGVELTCATWCHDPHQEAVRAAYCRT